MRSIASGLILVGVVGLLAGQMAYATITDELQLTSGGLTATLTDNVVGCVGTGCGGITGDLVPATAGKIIVSGTLNGWDITIIGVTHSPGLSPVGIDVSSLTASCAIAGGCTGANSLHVIFSDINFNIPVGINGFTTTYSNTQAGTGTTSESAYFDNGNGIFTETTLIGTVGPFSGSNHGSASGGPIAAVPLYSLTLDQVFSGSDNTTFSVDGNVTAVPEPGSVLLLGTVLFSVTKLLRRRQRDLA